MTTPTPGYSWPAPSTVIGGPVPELDPVGALTSAAIHHAGIVAAIAEQLERDAERRQVSRLASDAEAMARG